MGESGRQQAERIFQAAADLLPEQREAYLDEQCGKNHLLRAQVVRLLAHFDHPQIDSLNDPEIQDPFDDLEPEGREIGPYKLLKSLGEGGFGTVYLAEQIKPIQRRVALKIVKLGMDTKQVIARFEAERQALALMDHPNIARVFDAGATEKGRPYFVMELVKGVPVTEFCDSNALNLRNRLGLFIRICQAVQHAHHKGIIHRDLKPSNILVGFHDDLPIPKIIDFGIARATDRSLTDKTILTCMGHFMGTPQYMSPEQAVMDPSAIDTRTDIYSLGAVLYELLTGSRPFDEELIHRAGLGEIQRILIEDHPKTPSHRFRAGHGSMQSAAQARRSNPKTLSRLLHGDLDRIVMKAMDKD
ncbi:MAG: serine/threonine protein kinase, partial [Planctomycetes bacterium]|nr:serine/threonine protein kinase [Planctomycetota bacterium]